MNTSANIGIMKKYSSQQWKMHNQQLSNIEKYYQSMLKEKQREIDAINRQRKTMQLNASKDLNSLENKWWTYVNKNNQIELECALLERQLKEKEKQQINRNDNLQPDAV